MSESAYADLGMASPLLERYRMKLRAMGKAEETIRCCAYTAKRFLAFFGKLDCHDLGWLRDESLEEWLSSLSRLEKRTRNAYAMRVRVLLKAFDHPLANRIRKIQAPKPTIRLPSDEDILKLLYACRSKRDRAMLYLAYCTGMRIGEILALSLGDVNLRDRSIHVKGIKQEDDRRAPFDGVCEELLRDYLAGEPPRMPDEPLFTSRTGKRLSRGHICRVFRSYALRAGLIGAGERRTLTWHKLCHKFGTVMAQRIGVMCLKEILGHKSLETTAQYLYPDFETIRQAYDRAMPTLRLKDHNNGEGHP